MSRDVLCPPLRPPLSFARSAALLDKVDLAAGDWIIEGNPDSLQGLLLDLSETTSDDAEWEPNTIFQRRTLDHRQRSFLRILGQGQGRGTQGRPALVFGGWVNINPIAPTRSPDLRGVSVRADLRLNLNRYLQAQPLGGGPRRRVDRRYGQPRLVITPDEDWFSEEVPLVLDTNVLIGPERRFRYVASRNILDHFSEYFETVLSFLSQRLRAIARSNRCGFVYRPHLSLQRVEACWEFSTPTPIDAVDSVRRALEAVAQSSSTRYQRVEDLTSDTRGMSRRVSVRLNRTTQLRLYPKTTGRVRYEAVLDRGGLEPVIGRRTSQEANQTATLRRWLEQCIEHGIGQLAQTEALMGASPRLGAGRQPPHSLLLHIAQATTSRAISEALIALLVHEGCIRLSDLSLFRGPVERLVRAGVLRRTRPRSQVFVLLNEYAEAAEALHRLISARGPAEGGL